MEHINKRNSQKPLYIIIILMLVLIVTMCTLFLIQFSNHNDLIEKINYNTELITILSQNQEQLTIQNEILLLELSKLDSILLLENLSKTEIKNLKQNEISRNKKLARNLEEINRQLNQTDTISSLRYSELQNELNYNRKRLIKSSEPKLVIEGISGKVIGDDNNWTVKYSFFLKNYGGDIAKLKLYPETDTIPSIKFPLPLNGKLPHLGAISVSLSSKTLTEDYHETYLHLEDSYDNSFRQKITFIQNEMGFRFDLGLLEETEEPKNYNKQ